VTERLLIRGGQVLSMDPDIGTLPRGDVLVEDGVIAQVGPDLSCPSAQVLDASHAVVVPGLVDTHRHTWQSLLRGLCPDATLGEYLDLIKFKVGTFYRPEDVHVANRLGALEALNAGITTLVDWSHISNTPEHADAAVAGLGDAGIRAVYAHGYPQGVEWFGGSALRHPSDVRRLRASAFSSADQLLTLAVALRQPSAVTADTARADWALAREVGARITVHARGRRGGAHDVDLLDELGLMGPDTTYVHCNGLSDHELSRIADSGGTASVAPTVEMQMGHGVPMTGRLLAHGIRPTLGVDVATSAPGDLFTQMRTAYFTERMQASLGEAPFAPALSIRDVLQFATVDGAEACGLGHKVGSLTPGKDADIVLISTNTVNMVPLNDPWAAVVTCAEAGSVDTVLVRGRARKLAGRLVDVDLAALAAAAEASRDHVLRSSGIPPEGVAPATP
jgi:5-methylthioadenosine/S-adenosylhomocysteine deaminase